MPSSAGPATTARRPLSLHDALPIFAAMYMLRAISGVLHQDVGPAVPDSALDLRVGELAVVVPLVACLIGLSAWPNLISSRSFGGGQDRKSTRLNSSHSSSPYAVVCWSGDHRAPPSVPTRRSSDLRRDVHAARDLRCAAPGRRPCGARQRTRPARRRARRRRAARRLPDRPLGLAEPHLVSLVRRRTRSEEHTSELQSQFQPVCRRLLVRRPPRAALCPYTTLFRSSPRCTCCARSPVCCTRTSALRCPTAHSTCASASSPSSCRSSPA